MYQAKIHSLLLAALLFFPICSFAQVGECIRETALKVKGL